MSPNVQYLSAGVLCELTAVQAQRASLRKNASTSLALLCGQLTKAFDSQVRLVGNKKLHEVARTTETSVREDDLLLIVRQWLIR
jgi:hypothetical protein